MNEGKPNLAPRPSAAARNGRTALNSLGPSSGRGASTSKAVWKHTGTGGWIDISVNGIITDKEELCRLIMESAIDKVEKLGFKMRLGRSFNRECLKMPVVAELISYVPIRSQ